MGNFDQIEMLIRVPVILLALTIHEFCHAYFALRMGDPTAYRLGRCTLNPLKHLDVLGTICLLFAPIGWAKPVPINPLNFDDRRMGILVSTAAGPLSNLVQAAVFALVLRFTGLPLNALSGGQATFTDVLSLLALLGVFINVGLAVFNCLPLYPLDGFHILTQFMRRESQERFLETARFGPFMIMGLLVVEHMTDRSYLSELIHPVVEFFLRRVSGL